MKTFEEALTMICQKVGNDLIPTEAEVQRVSEAIKEESAPYADTILDIQGKPAVHDLAHAFIDTLSDYPGCEIVSIAFAHGVAVGLAINKIDIDETLAKLES